MDRLFNPFYSIDFIYSHGLIFLDQDHLKAYEVFTPVKRRDDKEWASTVYMLTADIELRSKAAPHINSVNREINWDGILSTDFGHGHRTAIYWSFGLWGGRSWGGWEDEEGNKVPKVDITSEGFSMGSTLQLVSLVAQAYRWGLSGKIPALAKVFNGM
ncbi:MAG: hypothetical protein JL50_00765 [Peptococcaceae bacterium BICA1-7]|nr:MAG: hypothetical protein JL50_00765 [Peptococcaceae bacterium BICA1-7]HBV98080.1 hypothetical protein [Desulfotomaculum sp.]